MPEHPNAVILRQALEAFNRGDIQQFADIVADDVEWHQIGEPALVHGKQALADSMPGEGTGRLGDHRRRARRGRRTMSTRSPWSTRPVAAAARRSSTEPPRSCTSVTARSSSAGRSPTTPTRSRSSSRSRPAADQATPEADHLGCLLLALELERPALEARVEAGSGGGIRGDQDLAGSGRGGQPGGDVDGIADGGQLHVAPSPTAPNQAMPVWTPAPMGTHGPFGSAWPVARGARGPPRRRVGVPLAGEQREEHRHQLVADELVDRAVVVEHDARRGGVEAIQHARGSPRTTCPRPAMVEPRMSAKSIVTSISAPP